MQGTASKRTCAAVQAPALRRLWRRDDMLWPMSCFGNMRARRMRGDQPLALDDAWHDAWHEVCMEMISIVMSLMTRLQHRLSELEGVFDLGTAEVRYVRVPDAHVPPELCWNPDWAAPAARAFSSGGMSSGAMGDRWLRFGAMGDRWRYYEHEGCRSSS